MLIHCTNFFWHLLTSPDISWHLPDTEWKQLSGPVLSAPAPWHTRRHWLSLTLWVNIWHQTDGIRQLASEIWHKTASRKQLAAEKWHQQPGIRQLASKIWPQPASSRQLAADNWQQIACTRQLAANSWHQQLAPTNLPSAHLLCGEAGGQADFSTFKGIQWLKTKNCVKSGHTKIMLCLYCKKKMLL